MTTEKDKNDNEDDIREETPEEEYDVGQFNLIFNSLNLDSTFYRKALKS